MNKNDIKKNNASIRIAFFDSKPYDIESFERINAQFGFKMKFFGPHLTADTAVLTKGYDAVCVFVNDYITRDIGKALEDNGISLIALRSAGYNNVDVEHIPGSVTIVRVPAYSPYAVAEHTLALLLTLNRKTHRAYYRTRDSNFSIVGLMGFDLHGKTAGIIGTGKIGKIVCELLQSFKMKVLAFDPYSDKTWAEETGVEYTDLESLYKNSDVISLHCPLTPENVHMINDDAIDKMKTGVIIINTGRGKLINTPALIRGLKSNMIGAAGLDVYEEETEYFFEDYSGGMIRDDVLARLLTFPNVLVTSHQAFFTREAMDNIAETTLRNIEMYFAEEELPKEVCVIRGNGRK